MTTERKPIMDEDLARIELDLSALDPDAAEYHWIAAAHVRRLLKALPALVAEVRELRQALEPFAAKGREYEAWGENHLIVVKVGDCRRAARIVGGLPAEEQPGEWELHLETSHPDG